MSAKKSKRKYLIWIIAIILLIYFFGSCGGGGGGFHDDSGKDKVDFTVQAKKIVESAKSTAGKILNAFSRNYSSTKQISDPVQLEQLAAWSASHRGTNDDSPPELMSAVGFPGVIFLRYNPPSNETGFSAIMEPSGLEPIEITGSTSSEFCNRLSGYLAELAKSSELEYTRFYALETDYAGPSQTQWLSETVKSIFPGIYCDLRSSTKSSNNESDQ